MAALDTLLGEECVFFVDAYVTDLAACARRMRHPERLVGYGVLGVFEAQSVVEIVDSEAVTDDALELAQEFFGDLGKASFLVEDVAGALSRTNDRFDRQRGGVAVGEEVASPDDVDTAMRLGANYPIGPIAWGREIGGRARQRGSSSGSPQRRATNSHRIARSGCSMSMTKSRAAEAAPQCVARSG